MNDRPSFTHQEYVQEALAGLHRDELIRNLYSTLPSAHAFEAALEVLAANPGHAELLEAIRHACLKNPCVEVRAFADRLFAWPTEEGFAIFLEALQRDPWLKTRCKLAELAARYLKLPDAHPCAPAAYMAGRPMADGCESPRLRAELCSEIVERRRARVEAVLRAMQASDPEVSTAAGFILK